MSYFCRPSLLDILSALFKFITQINVRINIDLRYYALRMSNLHSIENYITAWSEMKHMGTRTLTRLVYVVARLSRDALIVALLVLISLYGASTVNGYLIFLPLLIIPGLSLIFGTPTLSSIECTECSTYISAGRHRCPQCGRSAGAQSSRLSRVGLYLFVLPIATIVAEVVLLDVFTELLIYIPPLEPFATYWDGGLPGTGLLIIGITYLTIIGSATLISLIRWMGRQLGFHRASLFI